MVIEVRKEGRRGKEKFKTSPKSERSTTKSAGGARGRGGRVPNIKRCELAKITSWDGCMSEKQCSLGEVEKEAKH